MNRKIIINQLDAELARQEFELAFINHQIAECEHDMGKMTLHQVMPLAEQASYQRKQLQHIAKHIEDHISLIEEKQKFLETYQ